MGFALLIYMFSIVFGSIAVLASFILHRKTKKMSTLLILSAALIWFFSTSLTVMVLVFGGFTTMSGAWTTVALTVLSFLPAPLGVIGLLLYAIKLPRLTKESSEEG